MSAVCHLLSSDRLVSTHSQGLHGRPATRPDLCANHRTASSAASVNRDERARGQAGGEGVAPAGRGASRSIAFGEADFGGRMATQPKQREHT